ncbi:OmpA family protein [Alloprevotella tannerae]|uniref:OmpA family protein n=1 Tax=Alloprevotella tannerae TaxID=76122 RepID=UPI0028E7B384|nr:OmpA family protein [Alloprevotella tannerae]
MRKIISVFAFGALVALGANAQGAFVNHRFFDNWSLGLNAGSIAPVKGPAFWKHNRANFGLELTKQITPVFGLGFEGEANVNTTPSLTAIDQVNASVLAKVNITNWFCGYKGTPRPFELEAVGGLGWGYMYDSDPNIDGTDFWTSKFGLNFNFNLGAKRAWTIALKPAIVYNLDHQGFRGLARPRGANYDINTAAVELRAGLTYHFKTSNGEHYFTKVRAYDQGEIDGLNGRINDLRGQLADKDGQLSDANRRINDLQNQLNDCRNRKPIVKETTTTNNLMTSAVTFRQGKSVVDPSQMPNVERVATYLVNHKEATVVIKGYASPEGSLQFNEKLAAARANAVKTILVKRYRIAASRITAEGQGIGNMFSEPDWNRVSICTLDQK